MFYKIRHKETGLFYRPNQGSYSGKTNLSKNGKVYQSKPSFKHLIGNYYHPLAKNEKPNQWERFEIRPFIPEEWEIIEYSEVATEQPTTTTNEL